MNATSKPPPQAFHELRVFLCGGNIWDTLNGGLSVAPAFQATAKRTDFADSAVVCAVQGRHLGGGLGAKIFAIYFFHVNLNCDVT